MSPDERNLLELIWSNFKTEGRWPNEELLWFQLKNMGLDWEALAEKVAWLEEGPSYVRAGLETLMVLPEVRDILAPVPQFLQRLVRHFVEHQGPIDDDSAETEIGLNQDAFFPFWKDPAQAQRALWLLRAFVSLPLGLSYQSDSEFSFHPRLDLLRFERVEGLDQLLDALRPPVVGLIRQAPKGVHLVLLEHIYARVREGAQWPRLVDLALQLDRGQFGYVPDRLVEMMPAFIHEDHDSEHQLRVHLTAQALPHVAGDAGCAIALKLVHALVARLVEARSESPEVTIEQLAEELKLPIERVFPVARLLEREPWCFLLPWPKHRNDWRIRLHKVPLWKLKDVKTWAAYVEVMRPMWTVYEPAPPPPPPRRLSRRQSAAAILDDAVPLWADSGSELHVAPAGAARTTPQRGRPKVFIGHGHSSEWRELRDFLRDKLQLETVEFNSTPSAGYHTVERLKQCLDECGMAFLVMTAEDALPDGSWQARANVIHEIGLFQGRLGFDKAVILMEEGCREFSNIAGLTRINFPRGAIRACFEEIREVVEHRLPTGRHGAF